MEVLPLELTFWTVAVFMAVAALVLLAGSLVGGTDRRVRQRLQNAPGPRSPPARVAGAQRRLSTALNTLGSQLVPDDQVKRSRLQGRLAKAGFYSSQAVPRFLALRLVSTLLPTVVCLGTGAMGFVATQIALATMFFAAGCGFMTPGWWLDRRYTKRQVGFVRSLPDFMDLLVACLESGLSLQAAVRQVTEELRVAHPVLSREMAIVLREIELGRPPHEALRHFADRSGTESLRTLSTFVEQAQRFGTTLADAFRSHADLLRTQRELRAEEIAQRAAVLILFPTVLFIFPAIFVVLAGPAVIQIQEHFSSPRRAASKQSHE
ncbi:MAG TPA: type II secretion system F family protein [Pirellulales bacterium]|nr:type II secretion system F family protein [Pirellulales bacterium]